jgi:hypothetical protein
MKAIKIQHKIITCGAWICMAATFLPGCKKLGGLDLQENTEHPTTTIDPHINKTAWQFLRDRGLGTAPADTIFRLMYQGIIYSGIDTNEYTKPGRTFIFLHADAILRKTGTPAKATTDCYFGKYLVGGQPASSWDQYPQEQVKNYFLSLIVQGEHTFENITPDPEFDKTLMPANYDPLNPESLITFRVINDRDSRLRINDFPGSAFPTPNLATPGLQARTAGILSTNGPIHVIDRVLFFQRN